jgi:hypothetical protein
MISSMRRSDLHIARSFACLASGLVIGCSLALSSVADAGPREKQKAVDLSRDAIKKYRARDYEAAGQLFLDAFELSGRPAQLRNAAKAYEEGSFLSRALDLWVRYKDLSGVNRDERAEAEAHIALIQEKQRNESIARSAVEAARSAELARRDAESARKAAEEAKATRVETGAPASEGTPAGGWVLAGAGGVMAITGVALWFVAKDQLSDLDARLATTNEQGLIVGTTPAAKDKDVSRINGQRIAAEVLIPVGAAAAVGGALWLIVGSSSPVEASVTVTPDGASGSVSLSF